MAPKISVIIPVYKVEPYLDACLNSVEAQTFRDYELILVDDGSPDSCGAICDAYAAGHPNTRVIHQTNAGLSEARNQGVKVARGEYITFIDSDDFVSPDYLEYLLHLAEKYGTEVSQAKCFSFPDGQQPCPPNATETERVIPAGQALSEICYGELQIYACAKLYKRYLTEKYPYPTGQLYEDTATTYKIVGDTKSIAYGSKVIYFWRQRKGSITHAAITEKHLFGITAAKEQLAYMEKYYPEAIPAARARCVMKIVDISYRLVMGKKDSELFKYVRNEVKPFVKPIMADRKVGMSLKLRALALSWGYVPCFILSKVYSIAKKDARGN